METASRGARRHIPAYVLATVLFASQGTTSADAATIISTPVQVSTPGFGQFTEPAVVADPTNNRNLFVSANEGSCVTTTYSAQPAYISSNGGTSWSTGQALPITRGHIGLDPAPAFDSNGILYDAYIDASCLNPDGTPANPVVGNLVVSNSPDKGAHWSRLAAVDNATPTKYYPDKPMMLADTNAGSPFSNRLYVVYSRVPNPGPFQPLELNYSTNGGASWQTTPTQVDPGNDTGGFLALGPTNGVLYAAWWDFTHQMIRTAVSVDGGAHFAPAAQNTCVCVANTILSAPPFFPLPNYVGNGIAANPALGVDDSGGPNNGNLYVVWADTPQLNGTMHIFFSMSKTQGATWSNPVQLDTGNLNNDAWQPTLAVDQSNGRVTAAWYDRRDDSATPNKKYLVYYTYSSDGGSTFLPQQIPVSTSQGDPTVDPAKRGTGDYMGISARCGTAHPVWVETHPVNPPTDTTLESQVFTTNVADHQLGTAWTQNATGPDARQLASMAFDKVHGTLVLFGGTTTTSGNASAGALNDTWTWDGCNWTKQPLQQNPPPARLGAGMAYDDVLGQVVLFGGEGSALNQLNGMNDTWAWDGTKWNPLTPTNSPPAAFGVSLARDFATNSLVLYEVPPNQKGTPVAQTWTFNGVTWSQQNVTGPPYRSWASMTYDQARSQVVLFGGQQISKSATTYMNDTWLWNGTSWAKANNPPPANLTGRAFMGMDYDATLGVTVMTMGSGAASLLSDTWYWDGTNWTLQNPTAPVTPIRDGFTMSYFGPAGTIVLANGVDSTPKLVAPDSWLY